MNPTTEQISEMTMAETESAIADLDRRYGLERTIKHYDEDVESAVNTLCDIWQRQERLRQLAGIEQATATYHARRQ
jgi:hypothetical protein